MKRFLLVLIALVFVANSAHATDIKTELRIYDEFFYSGEDFNATLDISNINILTADEIDVVMTVKNDSGEEVHTETKQITDLEPDEKTEVNFSVKWDFGWGNFDVVFDAQFKDEILPDNNKDTAGVSVKVGRDDAINIMTTYGGSMIDDTDFAVGLCYLPQNPYESGTVFTEDNGEYSFTSDTELWGGYLEINKYQLFDKPGYYMFVNSTTGEVTSNEIQSVPTTIPSSILLGGNNVVAGTLNNGVTYNWVKNYISQSRPDSVVNARVCVLMVTGFKVKTDAEEVGFNNIANRFKDELSKEKLGPGLASSSFDLQEQITGPELVAHIRKMRLKYDKIYFFYSGHGTKDGKLKTGNKESDYLSYDDLMKELYDTQAKDLCVVLECCYSGKAVAAAKANSDFNKRNIEIMTSSDQFSLSNAFLDSLNNKYIGLYSTQLFEGFGNPAADANKDGKTTLKEAHDWVMANNGKFIDEKGNTITLKSAQSPQSAVNTTTGGSELEKLADIFRLAAQETYNESETKDAVGRVRKQPAEKKTNALPDKPTKKLSDEDDVEPMVIEEGEYFGWIDLDKYSKYGHTTAYVTINLETETWELEEYDWYPQIEGDTTYNPFDSTTIVLGSDVEETIPVERETIHEEEEPETKDSICALIVSGSDDENANMEQSFINDCEMVENNLKNERLGPGLDAGSIRNEHKPEFSKLADILSNMKGNYKKVYFYYSGHGTESGWLGVGDTAWMSQKYLLNALMEINAEEYCIILDCCYSGIAKDLLDSINIPDGTEVELITASSADRVSYTNYHTSGDIRYGYGVFTLNFLKCFGYPDADTDGDGKTSLTESYNWVQKVDPTDTRGRRIDSLTRPTHTIVRKPVATPEKPVVTDDEAGVELEFTEIEGEMQLELKVDMSYHDYGLNLDKEIIYVTPEDSTSKIYDIDYTGTLNFKVNMHIDYTDYLHNLPEEENDNKRGVIWREDENDNWKAHLPSVYNSDKGTITALDVDHFSQWSVAIVGSVTSVENDDYINNEIAYPNPFENSLTVEFNITEMGLYQISMVDITGNEVNRLVDVYLENGRNQLTLDGSNIASGSYYVRISKGSSTFVIPVIKN
jgi:hypothetical protein